MGDIGPAVTVNTGDGFTVTGNDGTAEEIKANLESEELKPDDEPIDPKAEAKERKSKAASELGKAGGEASAKARAKAEKEAEKAEPDEKPKKEAKEAPQKAESAPPEPGKEEEHDRTKARLERLARERTEERQRREKAEARLEELLAKSAKPAGDGKPQIGDYQTAEEYAEALADHKVKETLRVKEENDRREAQASSNAEKVASFRKRMDDEVKARLDPRLGEAFPAFLLEPGAKIGAENVVAEEFVTSEHAKPIGLYFADHPEELDKILEMPNYREIVRAFAKLEERLSAKPAPRAEEPRGESRAAPPARSIPASVQGESGDEDVDGDDVPFDRHFKVYNSRDQKARRGR